MKQTIRLLFTWNDHSERWKEICITFQTGEEKAKIDIIISNVTLKSFAFIVSQFFPACWVSGGQWAMLDSLLPLGSDFHQEKEYLNWTGYFMVANHDYLRVWFTAKNHNGIKFKQSEKYWIKRKDHVTLEELIPDTLLSLKFTL